LIISPSLDDLLISLQHAKKCLRETLYCLDILKQIDIRNGEKEDAAYIDLQYHAEHIIMEVEADIVSAQENASTKLEEE